MRAIVADIDHVPENPMDETHYLVSETEINQLVLKIVMEKLHISAPGLKNQIKMAVARQIAAGTVLYMRKNITKFKGDE